MTDTFIVSENFQKVIDICKQYQNDESYVYKNCIDIQSSKSYLVVMQKLEDTQTNETRNIDNKNYAKYRADKLKVVNIINLNKPIEETKIITSAYTYILTTYQVGKNVSSDEYDKNDKTVCSSGIHYFKTIYPALFYGRWPHDYTGIFYGWYDDGNKSFEEEQLNGKSNGKSIGWHKDGNLKYLGEYIEGKKDGKWIFKNEDNDFFDEISSYKYYKKGIPTGIWTEHNRRNGTTYRLYFGANNKVEHPTMTLTQKKIIQTSIAACALACLSTVVFRKYSNKSIRVRI